jgi:hypothetical protein
MVAIANETGESIETDFNDERIVVRPGDTSGALYAAWKERLDARCKAYDESPAGQALAAAREENERIIREEAAKPLAVFDITNQPLWESLIEANKSEYGMASIRYVARWAALMEQRLKVDGATVATIAEQTSNDADIEGITGFMSGAARSILVQVWRHGEELRLWLEQRRGRKEPTEEALEEPTGRFFDLSLEN